MTESYDYEEIEKTMMYYGTRTVKESDFPFNFYLIDLPNRLSGDGAFDLVNLWMTNMPKGKWANWVVGDQLYNQHEGPPAFQCEMIYLKTSISGVQDKQCLLASSNKMLGLVIH